MSREATPLLKQCESSPPRLERDPSLGLLGHTDTFEQTFDKTAVMYSQSLKSGIVFCMLQMEVQRSGVCGNVLQDPIVLQDRVFTDEVHCKLVDVCDSGAKVVIVGLAMRTARNTVVRAASRYRAFPAVLSTRSSGVIQCFKQRLI